MQRLPVALALLLLLPLPACRHVPPPPTAAEAIGALPNDVIGPYVPAQGKVTVVTFIATWCFPCLVDLPLLNQLAADHPDDLQVLLVGMDLEGRKVLEPFAALSAPGLPLVVANERVRLGDTPFGKIAELPTRFVFRRDGTLALAYAGVGKPGALAEVVAKELGGR